MKLHMTLTGVVLFCVLAFPVSAQGERDDQLWFATLDVKVIKLRLLVRVRESAEGFSGTMTSLDQDNSPLELDELSVDGDHIRFELKRAKAIFEGTINDDNDRVTGEFTQNGRTTPLTFVRIEKEPSDLPNQLWEGVLKAGPRELTLRYRIFNSPDGVTDVKLDSITEAVVGLGTELSIDGKKYVFNTVATKGVFRAELNEAGDELTGFWEQAGQSLPFAMKKIATGLANKNKPVRPQTPKEPFPYDSLEVSFDSDKTGVTLKGTLTIPHGGARHPAVVLVTGSGPQDRDESILGHKPFHVIADYLSRNMIAVLRYDERGVGQSTGDFSTATSFDFADDAAAAVSFLAGHQSVDPTRIGVIGHSEGGIVAPLVASRTKATSFIILLAGTGVSGEEIIYNQSHLIASKSGASEEDLSDQKRLLSMVITAVKKMDDKSNSKEVIDAVCEEYIKSFPEEKRKEKELTELVRTKLERMSSPWFKNFLTYDPAPALKRLSCPVLVLNGVKDLQVDPVLNLPAIEKALKAGGNKSYEIHELAGLNHLFQPCKTGLPGEYAEIETTFSPEVLKLMSDWIRDTTN